MGSRFNIRSALVAAIVAVSAGCDVTLLRDLSREQADDAARSLDRSGVVARVISGSGTAARWRIEVDSASVATAVAALSAGRSRAMCPKDDTPPAANPWIETPGEERARHASDLSEKLQRSLLQVPGVIEARVHLTLPFGMRSLPEAQTPAAASVLVVREQGSGSIATAASELIAGAVPGLSPSAVRVVETLAPRVVAPRPEFARIGPVVVTRDSANTLKLWIAAALLLHMLLAAAVLRPLVASRRSKRERQSAHEAKSSEPPAPNSDPK